ncbi:MAG: CRTAC1 family protein, partial [Planctomycetota bacterium]
RHRAANGRRDRIAGSASAPPGRQILFRDVTAAAGIADMGLSFGASAGDANGDGWVDIFTGGHYTQHPRLWLNLQNGTFADGVQMLNPLPNGDLHGAHWADLDHDGWQELVLMRGAAYGTIPIPKFVYKNLGGTMLEVAPLVGLDVPPMRARTPLSWDFDEDGRLDLFLTAVRRSDGLFPTAPYRQTPTQWYSEQGPGSGFALNNDSLFGVLGDLDGDRRLDLLVHSFPPRAYRTVPGSATFVSITSQIGLPPVNTMNDAVIADFTGDGENEIYIARDPIGTSLHRLTDRRLDLHAYVNCQEHAVHIPVTAPHLFVLEWGPAGFWPTASIHIGSGGQQPASNPFTLDPGDPANAGIAPHAPGQSTGIYVGWNAAAGAWTIACSSPVWAEAMVLVATTAPMGQPTTSGFSATPTTSTDMVLSRVGGVYVNRTTASGIPAGLRGRSAVAADFDNDMDLDLYVLTSTTSYNTPDVLLENDGTGRFRRVPCGDGVGTREGIGDSVITLDYDRDGRVDLFAVNGDATGFRYSPPYSAFADDGPVQLLRNVTETTNHWLSIRLRGTASNRDGVGARIEVTAGNKTQVREQGGGAHRYSQNHGVHFGLGPNATATLVEVFWPNGTTTQVTNVPADGEIVVVQ